MVNTYRNAAVLDWGEIVYTVIAIDGPAGAGKSTLARRVADRLNFKYLDTGAMYRAVTLYVLNNDIDIQNIDKIISFLNKIEIEFLSDKTGSKNKRPQVLLNKENVTKKIRKPIIDKHVSNIARIKEVRNFLRKKQRDIARSQNIIVDGRDIGTRVFPEADFKFYVTASLEERAKRRYLEKGKTEKSLEDIKNEIKRRDNIDKNRKYSPLQKADDAVLIDTSDLTVKETVDKILEIIKKHQ